MAASGVTKLRSQMQNDMPKNEKTGPQVRMCMRYQLSKDRSVYFEARQVYPRQVLLYGSALAIGLEQKRNRRDQTQQSQALCTHKGTLLSLSSLSFWNHAIWRGNPTKLWPPFSSVYIMVWNPNSLIFLTSSILITWASLSWDLVFQ